MKLFNKETGLRVTTGSVILVGCTYWSIGGWDKYRVFVTHLANRNSMEFSFAKAGLTTEEK